MPRAAIFELGRFLHVGLARVFWDEGCALRSCTSLSAASFWAAVRRLGLAVAGFRSFLVSVRLGLSLRTPWAVVALPITRLFLGVRLRGGEGGLDGRGPLECGLRLLGRFLAMWSTPSSYRQRHWS